MRPTYAEISLSAIRHNIALVRKLIGHNRKLMVAVKADAYGHGLVPVAKTCLEAGIDLLGVAMLEEAIVLRESGSSCPILILGLENARYAREIVEFGISATVCTDELPEALSKVATSLGTRANVHIKVDTGMGRLGVSPTNAVEYAGKISKLKNIQIEGIFTHFPVADKDEDEFTLNQIQTLIKATEDLRKTVLKYSLHAANSAALLKYPQSYLDMVRPGLMIYGLEPFSGARQRFGLKPALRFRSEIVFIKEVTAGTTISYGRTYVADRKTRIATVPVGYADGYSRRLSNNAEVLVHGKRVPIVGTICMDQMMVDVGTVRGVAVGDEVALIGRQDTEEVTVEEIAGIWGTINYEVVCSLGKRILRIYVD